MRGYEFSLEELSVEIAMPMNDPIMIADWSHVELSQT